MNLKKSILGVFILLIFSCGNQKSDKVFSKEGVSFTYPSSWRIEKQRELPYEGYHVSIRNSGFDTGFDKGGEFSLRWYTKNLNRQRYLENIQESFFESQEIANDIKFESVRDNNFNGLPAISCDYTINKLGIETRGEIYVFLKGERTYSIIKQELTYYISKNKPGFDIIESTFKVE